MVFGIDARERAPIKSSENMFLNNNTDQSVEGGLASGIPGEIAGYWEAYKIGGRLPWKKLFEPSITFCRNGIKVSSSLATAIRQNEEKIRKNRGLANIFLNPVTNQTFKENDTMTMLTLAKTLEKIGEQGPDAFYNGELSEKIVNENKFNSNYTPYN
jgi:gamma-glutamyltranspeptidase/glutathione hydrolase/leukotriene-C4 hydrolase